MKRMYLYLVLSLVVFTILGQDKEKSNYSSMVIEDDLEFVDFHFESGVFFSRSTIKSKLNFDNIMFEKASYFSSGKFQEDVSFINCSFESLAIFNRAFFRRNVRFDSVHFSGYFSNYYSKYKGGLTFSRCVFDSSVSFQGSQFKSEVIFDSCFFFRRLNFDNCCFSKDVVFRNCHLPDTISLSELECSGTIDLLSCFRDSSEKPCYLNLGGIDITQTNLKVSYGVVRFFINELLDEEARINCKKIFDVLLDDLDRNSSSYKLLKKDYERLMNQYGEE